MKKFFDIHKFPKQEGILLFGISMNKVDNVQGAKKCFEYMKHFIPKVIQPTVGLNFVYSDSLYYNSEEKASVLKKRYQATSHSHKFGFMKLLKKNPIYIPNSFSFKNFSQMVLESKVYLTYLEKLKKIYETDKTFQEYVAKDIGKKVGEPNTNQTNFILEEILMFYLVSKGKVRLQNDYIQDKQKWVLWCYPGKPLFSEIYVYQKNFFNLSNEINTYENSYYDLENSILYDYTKIDLSTFEV